MKIIEFLRHPKKILLKLDELNIIRLSDSMFLKIKYKLILGKKLDLKNPKTFNEKLQWLKLHDRQPIYTKMVDKYEVKKYVAGMIGDEYIIPTIGVYDKFDDIDFDKLPDKFVIKCTHDSGGLVICKNKKELDIESAKGKIDKCLKRNYYYLSREWPYKDVKPRIIIEKYISDNKDGSLKDYKLFVLSGKVVIIQVDYDRFTNHKRNMYYRDWKYANFGLQYPNDEKCTITKPKSLDKMIHAAEKIVSNLGMPPFLRLDFYEVEGEPLFGEITFYHGAGFETFTPEEWDRKLGDMIDLNGIKNEN